MQANRFFGKSPYRCSRRVMKDRTSVYHVMNRTVRANFWLDDAAKEMFRKMMQKQAAFAGIEVLTYCMMNNHVHLLLRVPPQPLAEDGAHGVDDAELLRRYAEFYGADPSVQELEAALAEGGEVAEYARRRVLARMGNLSEFMRELKQRFAFWFNDKHDCRGTIWAERFKSVLVENTAGVLTQVAAYVDLNPVRARLVKDPKEYRWSGYGAAVRGAELARRGIRGLYPDSTPGWSDAIRLYRMLLYDRGSTEKTPAGRDCGRVDPETVRKVLDTGGRMSAAEALRLRVREFTESAALGSEAFVAQCRARWTRKGGGWNKLWTGWQRFRDRLSD